MSQALAKRIIVVGIVMDCSKLLFGKKASGLPPYPDVWHTLGGGVENFAKAQHLLDQQKYDDSYFHAELRRELKEEAQIEVGDIKNICPQYRLAPREAVAKNKHEIETHYIFLEYICKLEKGPAIPGSDIAELRWAERKELSSVTMTPPSKEMYKELGWM